MCWILLAAFIGRPWCKVGQKIEVFIIDVMLSTIVLKL